MSKVYVVWNDNGEQWEDNFRYIDKVFSTRESAEAYLDDGYERTDDNIWEPEKYHCKITGFNDCRLCKKYQSWVDLDYDADVPCDEYDNMDDDYDNQWCFIEEYEVLD